MNQGAFPNENTSPREEVENLQRYLRQLSFHEDALLRPPVDGIFEKDTEDALRRYQESRSLSPTGRADLRTWELLYEEYRTSLAEHSPPRAIEIFPRKKSLQRLQRGMRGFDVATLQHLLQELSYLYPKFEEIPLSGIYDAPTEAAVREFQRRNFIPETGEVDLLTWNSLADQYNLIFSRMGEE